MNETFEFTPPGFPRFDINNPKHYGINASVQVSWNGTPIGTIVFSKTGFFVSDIAGTDKSPYLPLARPQANKRYATKEEAAQQLLKIWKFWTKEYQRVLKWKKQKGNSPL